MKANYGYDAPYWIIACGISGILFLITAIGIAVKADFHSIWQCSLIVILAVIGIYLLSIAIRMTYSTKYGKFIVIKELVEELKLKGDETVLDAGCGRGLFLIETAKKLTSGKAIGVDLWRQQDQSHNTQKNTLRNAEIENVSNKITLHTADLKDLPLSENSVDIIVSSLVLHNISTQEARKKALVEFTRVLKPGGYLWLLDFQYTQEYLETLQNLSWQDVKISPEIKRMFPPVRIIKAQK